MKVNIKTYHVTYGMLRDFNPEGHNITKYYYKNKNNNKKIIKNIKKILYKITKR